MIAIETALIAPPDGAPHWLIILALLSHIATALGTLALVGIAIFAAIWAKRQVEAAAKANEHAAHQSKAAFLLELDRRWESREMSMARRHFNELEKAATDHMTAFIHMDGHRQKMEREEYYSRTLYTMMNQQTSVYLNLMRICGFWETMGYLVKNKYIPIENIVDLFGGGVISFDDAFRVHLTNRGEEKGVPDGFFEHALYLATEVRKLMKF
jgi:hypothetical protein